MIEPDKLVSIKDGQTPRDSGVEVDQDRALRPKKLVDYCGQPAVREQMDVFIAAARNRKEALDHTLVFGPPGLGKQRWRILLLMNWMSNCTRPQGQC